MSKDNKKLILYLGIIFLGVLLAYRLPQSQNSLIERMIPAVESSDSSGVFYPSSIIVLLLFVIGILGLANLKRFDSRSKNLIFILVLVGVIPLMNFGLDLARTNYHWIRGDGLGSIDILESRISLSESEDKLGVEIKLSLKDYGRGENRFKIRVYTSDAIKEETGEAFYEFNETYSILGSRNIIEVEEKINIDLQDDEEGRRITSSLWFDEDLEYELYNDEESIRIKRHSK